MSRGNLFSGAAVAALLSVALPTAGQATTYSLDTSFCSGGCTVPAGTVTAVTEGNGLDISVTLTNGEFRNNFAASLAFDLQNLPSGGTVQISQDATDLAGTNGALAWSQVTNTGSMDGVGSWDFGLTYSCAGGNGNCNNGTTLEFDVTDTAGTLTLANLVQGQANDHTPLWFVADVSSRSGNTGFVGAQTIVSSTPIPGAVALFGSVLIGGFGVAGWRKRRARGPVSLIA